MAASMFHSAMKKLKLKGFSYDMLRRIFVCKAHNTYNILRCLRYTLMPDIDKSKFITCKPLKLAPVVLSPSVIHYVKGRPEIETDVSEEEIHQMFGTVGAIGFYADKGRLAADDQEYDLSDKFYQTALKIAVQGYKMNKDITQQEFFANVAMIYSEMAQVKLEQGKFQESANLLIEAISGLLKIGMGTINNNATELTLKLAILYAAGNNDLVVKAKALFNAIIESQEEKLQVLAADTLIKPHKREILLAETDILLATALDRYGKILVQLNEVKLGKAMLAKSYEIGKKYGFLVLGEKSEEKVVPEADVVSSKPENEGQGEVKQKKWFYFF